MIKELSEEIAALEQLLKEKKIALIKALANAEVEVKDGEVVCYFDNL